MPAALRNVLIIAALAALVAFAPGGGTTGGLVIELFSIAFLGALVLLGWRLYREHRLSLYALGDRNRAILYGSLGLVLLALSGIPKLWDTGIGSLVWFVLIAAAGVGLYTVWRSSREY